MKIAVFIGIARLCSVLNFFCVKPFSCFNVIFKRKIMTEEGTGSQITRLTNFYCKHLSGWVYFR